MLESAVTFDEEKRAFSFYKVDDLALSGSSSAMYRIIVTGETGNIQTKSSKSSFKLTIRNPCIDTDYVKIGF